MQERMDRRLFLDTIAKAGVVLGAAAVGLTSQRATSDQGDKTVKKFNKAIILGMVDGNLSTTDKFKLARDVGFDGIEVPPLMTPEAIEEIQKAVADSGIPAHSIIFGGWGKPLSHPDPKIADEGLQELVAALKAANQIGADGVLLVPAVVNKDTRYVDAYKRSHERLKRAVPIAEQLQVKINVEEVWNKFLLSPLEFARYVDDFQSPWVRAYFDVANVVDFGWPEDWIRTLGTRIDKIHIKDFRRSDRAWPPLGEGDVDFPRVMEALDEIGYSGWLTCELPGGDEAHLREISRRVDLIIEGKNPAE